jgi:hypothetical protein
MHDSTEWLFATTASSQSKQVDDAQQPLMPVIINQLLFI